MIVDAGKTQSIAERDFALASGLRTLADRRDALGAYRAAILDSNRSPGSGAVFRVTAGPA
jgi:hypothetical protein